jgi:fructose-1,6-bisphosphatase/inositol monophosphatase family enzyme
MTGTQPPIEGDWSGAISELCAEIRGPVRAGLAEVAAGRASLDSVAEAVSVGAGDVTFAIDVVAEQQVTRWLEREGARRPLSLMTEDAGWRHVGPGPDGSHVELSGFDHGGPRIALDPIDGTRNIMHDVRSAWIVVSLAGPGAGAPRFEDVEFGVVSELPDTRAAVARELSARRGGGACMRRLELGSGADLGQRTITADSARRLDGGYFPCFGFHPALRPHAQRLGAHIARRVAEEYGADESRMFDDQYISSGGQLALLALGRYRSIVDARGEIGARVSDPRQTCKPYDMAGAALVAQEAGCVVVRPDGAPLDFELDTHTTVDFAGFHNRATAEAILPFLREGLDGL